ncbi:MAG: hypothetical protein IJW55_01730 [Clostridia bacterium]|nr:hypothetical protein [Clostridia bacterium]
MKKTRILSFLLVFAMLCGLVCIPATAEVNSADDWQLADGWEANPLTFTYNDYLSLTSTTDNLIYVNPNASTETAADWSFGTDVYFDTTEASPNQRMQIELTMASGDLYKVVLQRRLTNSTIQIRTQFGYYDSTVGDSTWRYALFTLDSETVTVGTVNGESTDGEVPDTSPTGTKVDIWSSALGTATIANNEASYHVELSCVSGKTTLTITTVDGRALFSLIDTEGILSTSSDVISKIAFKPETSGTDNTWDISRLTVTNGTTVTTAPQDPANYKIGKGWSYSTGFELHHDNETAQGAKATYTVDAIGANEGFELQFDINHLDFEAVNTSTYPTAMTQIKIGEYDVLIRIARRYNANIFKNYHTIEIKGSNDTAWTKITDKWVDTPEYTSYRFNMTRASDSGDITMTWSTIDGTVLCTTNTADFTTTDENGDEVKKYNLNSALSSVKFYGQNNEGNWKYTNMSLNKTVNNTTWTEVKDFTSPSAWTLESGWSVGNAYSLLNASKAENKFAKYELLTNEVGDFEIAYEVDFLTTSVQTQNNFEFYLGDNLFSVRTGRRPSGNVMKNLFMFTCNNGSEIKMSDSWVDYDTYGVGDNAKVSITYDADTATLVVVVGFYNGTTRTWGQTVTVSNGQYAVNTNDATEAAIEMSGTDALTKLTFDAGKPDGIYRINNLIIDTEADVKTTGFKLVGVQDTAPADSKINVRFVGVVDQLDVFQKIGIKVDAYADGEFHKTFDIGTTEVYKTITANVNGVNTAITAEELGGTYAYALTINGVPASGVIKFVVTPYTVDVNDSNNVTDYATYEVIYENGEYVSGTKVVEEDTAA